ncbi:MAG: carboxypeptidase regulatory-like domain-containing protein [Phycisphaerae bacterium]|nr:carboxypeptidase regulatory-like domain-containing protein [Phycisphaerae bacterium]
MRLFVSIVVAACLLTAAASAETLRHVRIEAENPAALAVELDRAGYDVLMGSVTANSLELIVSTLSLDRLKALGYEPEILAVGRPLRDIQAEWQAAGDDVPPGYPDLATIYADMTAAATNYPSICQMVDVTVTYNRPETYENRHLYAVKISDNVTQEEDEPAILLVSCHHAREISTPTIAMYAIEQLTTQYGIDPQITAAVDNNEIWIAPMWNPDGYNHVYEVDNMWRKNRRVFATGIGVDQNRNYPFGWYTACSGSTDPSSDTYKGPSPASEAETQTMITWSEDQHFAKILDYHSYGQEALHGYACLTHPFDTYLQQEATALSNACGYGGSIRPPSADGEHYQWQLGTMGAHSNLVETHTTFAPSYSSALSEAAQVWLGILWMIERPITLWGHVTDAVSGEPVEASIELTNVSFPNGETNASFGPFGRYHAFMPTGTYDLAFAADGYDPLTITGVAVNPATATQLDVAMSPPPQLTFPNGGETLTVNVPATVTWTGSPTLQFHVQQTSNHGDFGYVLDSFERPEIGSAYTTGGAAPWDISYVSPLVGTRSARSGDISHNEVSWMTRTVAGGDVSFWYRVSSEENGDYFNFYVNGDQEVHVSGQTGWTNYSTTLAAGNYELKWEYAKNATSSAGSDSAWIDYLEMVADQTVWTDIVALTDPGATSAPWTPTELSEDCKVRIRSYYAAGYYGAWGESADTFTVAEGPAVCRGDANCDAEISWRDIDFFVAGMNDNQAAWEEMFLPGSPACSFTNLDVNIDGTVSWRDIDPFVEVMNTTCP